MTNEKLTYEELENQIAELEKQNEILRLNSIFQNVEKEKRAAELIIANKELDFQNEEKRKRIAKLIIAEHKIEESDEKYRISEIDLKKAQSVARLGNWKWDLKTSEVIWSDEMFQIFGIDKNSYKGRLGDVITNVIYPDDLHLVLPSNASEFAEKKPIEYRIILPDKSIRYIWAEAGETILDINDKPLFLTGIAQDITERKLTEIELKKEKEKAEESDRLKTAFLNNISHEVRTPMNSIIGFSQLIAHGNITIEKQKKFSEIINDNCNQLLENVTNIIEISQIQSNQVKVKEQELFLETIYNEISELFKSKCETKNINLTFNCQNNLFENNTITDYYKLLRILKLLIDNAIKFTNSGKIVISCGIVENSFFEFSISDTGIGISQEMQQKIFEPFRQVETGLSRNYGGSGVGLSIVKAYVELLGGKIWLKSVINEGTTFYFTIPYKPVAKQETKTENQQNIIDFSHFTVLIAEDEYANFMLIEEYLIKTKVKILYAANGQQAIDYCRDNNAIDFVLMDIKMPIIDGHTATKLIKQFRSDLIIIAQTAYAAQHDKEIFLESGFDDYICKPLKQNLLIEILQKQINKLITT